MKNLTTLKFLRGKGLTLDSELIDKNPNMPDFKGNHYKCYLRRNGKGVIIFFSKGFALNGKPEILEIIDCLANDAQAGKDYSFKGFCQNFGYDTDSRSAESIFNECKKIYKKLQKLFTPEELDALLYDVEKL